MVHPVTLKALDQALEALVDNQSLPKWKISLFQGEIKDRLTDALVDVYKGEYGHGRSSYLKLNLEGSVAHGTGRSISGLKVIPARSDDLETTVTLQPAHGPTLTMWHEMLVGHVFCYFCMHG